MNQEKIGKYISDLRKENDMTQEQLAEKMGVTDKSISRWENGKTDIEEKCMPVRCASLGCRKTRSFAMSDTITLNVPSAFVISSRAVAVCNDIRKINNKIMLKIPLKSSGIFLCTFLII